MSQGDREINWKEEIKRKVEEHAQKRQERGAKRPLDVDGEAGGGDVEQAGVDFGSGGSGNEAETAGEEVTVSLGRRPRVSSKAITFRREESETEALETPSLGSAEPAESEPEAKEREEVEEASQATADESASEREREREAVEASPEGEPSPGGQALEQAPTEEPSVEDASPMPSEEPSATPQSGEKEESPSDAGEEQPDAEDEAEGQVPEAGLEFAPPTPEDFEPDEAEADEAEEAAEPRGDDGEAPPESEELQRVLFNKRESSQEGQTFTFAEKAEAGLSPLDQPLRRGSEEEEGRRRESAEASGSAGAGDGGEPSPYEDDFPDEDLEEADELWVPREIFVSRFLAGLIDILLAGFSGLLFAAGASWLLGFDLLGPSTLQISSALALLFFLVNSVFFLRLSGQTPGMHVGRLKVVHEDASHIPLSAAVGRVLAFLPALGLLGTGLLWGLFDPWGRCLHDRLSRTRVVR